MSAIIDLDDWYVLDSMYYLSDADGDGIVSLLVMFEGGKSIVLSVVSETDEIAAVVAEKFDTRGWKKLEPLSEEVAGLGVRWLWSLVNSNGYTDGVQFDLGPRIGEAQTPRGRKTLQIMAAGATLDIMEVVAYGGRAQ